MLPELCGELAPMQITLLRTALAPFCDGAKLGNILRFPWWAVCTTVWPQVRKHIDMEWEITSVRVGVLWDSTAVLRSLPAVLRMPAWVLSGRASDSSTCMLESNRFRCGNGHQLNSFGSVQKPWVKEGISKPRNGSRNCRCIKVGLLCGAGLTHTYLPSCWPSQPFLL